MRLTIIKSFAVIGLVFGISACASQDTQMKLHSLEEKINQALMNSAAAKVDATTALHIALQNEKK